MQLWFVTTFLQIWRVEEPLWELRIFMQYKLDITNYKFFDFRLFTAHPKLRDWFLYKFQFLCSQQPLHFKHFRSSSRIILFKLIDGFLSHWVNPIKDYTSTSVERVDLIKILLFNFRRRFKIFFFVYSIKSIELIGTNSLEFPLLCLFNSNKAIRQQNKIHTTCQRKRYIHKPNYMKFSFIDIFLPSNHSSFMTKHLIQFKANIFKLMSNSLKRRYNVYN